ncbi:MAG TPA: hypothetical protein VNW92_31710 [Polyangiaceae bacterium]|nr:hypothetical protein [Polyangiaceae bacterium]
MRKSLLCSTLPLLVASTGCTTLGPMPATTGVAMAPAGRPDIDVHAGLVPGYYLSSAVTPDGNGTAMREVGAVIEPDHWLSVPGLFAGARYAGEASSGAAPEPLLGYRSTIGEDRSLGVGVVAFGTHAQATQKSASFSATRGGAEAGADLRLTPDSHWLELHMNASAALTGLSAHGSYCVDSAGSYGVDCPDGATPVNDVHAGGVYPSVNFGMSLNFAQHLDSAFHGGRFDIGAGAGTMPRVLAGEQASARSYVALGGTLSLAFGALR